jgi:hypothetical protein
MVEIILSEHQLACLKAAVPKGSIEQAALDAGDYFAGSEITPEPIAVTLTCTMEVARQLLAIARTSCPDVATGIRAAIDQQAPDARLWHPWLRINRVLRVMLHTRWSAEAWAQVRVEFRRALALRSEIRRAADGYSFANDSDPNLPSQMAHPFKYD